MFDFLTTMVGFGLLAVGPVFAQDVGKVANDMKGACLVQVTQPQAKRVKTGPSLSAGEFVLRDLTDLPSNWGGSCDGSKLKGGCRVWEEFALCGKTEEEVDSALGALGKQRKPRVIGPGSRGKKCPKLNKKCIPYMSALPVTCEGGGDPVYFLVHVSGNIGRSVKRNAYKVLVKDMGLSEPYTCDMEYWLRVRMSETLETHPSPFLVSEFPEVQNQQDSQTASLVQEAAELEGRLLDQEEGDSDLSLVQHEREQLQSQLIALERKINSTHTGIQDTMQRLIDRFGHSHGIALGARFIRMTFHDAADYQNLIGRGKNGQVERVCSADHKCGGVDFRLHTALLSVGLSQHSLPVEDDPDDLYADEEAEAGASEALGDPNHNRGLTNAFQWVRAWSSHQGVLSKADTLVLGAHVAVENWFSGPEMTFSAGRVDASHQKALIHEAEYCTHEDCLGMNAMFLANPVAEPVASGMFCPFHNTLEELGDLIGLSQKELIALQGSHSVGGIIRCSGMGNTAGGPFCGGVKCCPPGMQDKNGQCECTDGDCRNMNKGLNGASFDGTPNILDNMYYQQLAKANFTELPDCSSVAEHMPGMSSADQKLYICMKKKGHKWNSNSKGATWQQVVDAGCEHVVKSSYSGYKNDGKKNAREMQCRTKFQDGGAGIDYPSRSWCEFDDCMQACEEKNFCAAKPLSEIAVLMGKFQNKDYGKSCNDFVTLENSSMLQPILDSMDNKKYGSTTIANPNLQLLDQDGNAWNVNGLQVTHYGFRVLERDNGKERFQSKKLQMKSYLEEELEKVGVTGSVLNKPLRLWFADPEDPYCNQCTVPACKKDAMWALQEAVGAVMPNNNTDATTWLKNITHDCMQCKHRCQTPNNVSKAANRAPEWCLTKAGESFCARGGKGHECPKEHRFGIPNHGDGRRSTIVNTMRWSRFRGQTRRIMMLPSDWALLGNKSHKAYVDEFARDNEGWRQVWKEAFTKVSEAGQLEKRQCKPIECSLEGGNITCATALNPGMGQEALVFNECKMDGSTEVVTPTGDKCTFKRSFGVKAVFDCGSSFRKLYCTTERARQNIEATTRELDYGQDHLTCFADYELPSFLQKTASAEGEMRQDDPSVEA